MSGHKRCLDVMGVAEAAAAAACRHGNRSTHPHTGRLNRSLQTGVQSPNLRPWQV